jgi:hypothetical protein
VFRLTGNPLAAAPREEIVRTGRLIGELAAHLTTLHHRGLVLHLPAGDAYLLLRTVSR